MTGEGDKAPPPTDLYDVVTLFLTLSRRAVEISAARSAAACLETLEKILRDPLRLETYQILDVAPGGATAWRLGLRPEEIGAPVDEGLVRWALKGSQTVLVPWEPGRAARAEARSLILIPVTTHERPYALVLAWVPYTEEQSSHLLLQALETLAREAAFTLENLERDRQNLELRELVDNVLESVPHGILAVDRDDRILTCNRNLEFLFRVNRAAIRGRSLTEAFPHAVAQLLTTLTLNTLKGQETTDFEYEHRVDEKTSLHLGLTSSLLASAGSRPLGVLFVVRDLSLSREVVKLRELDEMKSAFVHTVSHELKTPLTAILGGCELLTMQADALNAEQRELVGIVDAGAKRLNALVTDLLDISRLESGRVHLEPAPIDLAEIAREVAALVQPRNPRAPIRFEVADPLPEPEADRAKIRQVVENFLSNAMKYSPNGGEVLVRIGVEGDRVRFEVSDAGLGIPEKHLPFVWDKFHRVDNVAGQIEGTGLGLAIAKHIVEMHGGRVWVKSVEGKGSTFGFSLPL